MLKYFFALLLFGAAVAATAQEHEVDPMLIRLKARIVSLGDSMAVPYANIVNNRTHSGTSSNAGGFFSIEMLNVDSLVVSAMGFKKQVVHIPRNYSEENILTIFMQPVVFAIREVEVKGDKQRVNMDGIPVGKQVDIDPELRGDAFNEKPPVLAALFNPISYWQYYLSKKEKQKRRVREAIELEKNWEMHSQNYNLPVVMMLTGTNEEQAEKFMIWFNSQNVLPYTATEYDVRASVRKYFEIYKRQGLLKE